MCVHVHMVLFKENVPINSPHRTSCLAVPGVAEAGEVSVRLRVMDITVAVYLQ